MLIGDYCIDEYQYGFVERLSPEAPVPVLKSVDKIVKDGMAGNVKNNLEALGCKVVAYFGKPSTKTRIVDKKTNQQIVRIDNDVMSMPLKFDEVESFDFDAIVISDYDKGFVSYDLIDKILETYKGFVFIDTKKTDLQRMSGACVKINEAEYRKAKSLADRMVVTLGSRGAMHLFRGETTTFYSTPSEVVDVTGAGDTFLAALVYYFLHSADMNEAIRFANRASAVTVRHMGVYAPRKDEI